MTENRPKKFGFSKAERLSGKKKIEELFQHGSSIFFHPFLLKFVESGDGTRVLISVPKKRFKRAADRNLIKRRIREAYRLNKHLLTNQQDRCFHVAFIYHDTNILTFTEIEKKLIILLKRLVKEISKADEKN